MANARIVEFLLSGVHNQSGVPFSAGKVYSFEAGTTTSKDLYTDAAKTTPATNPVILDSYGRAIVYADGDYKFIVKDSDGNTIFTVDNFQNQLELAAHKETHEEAGTDEVTPAIHHTRHETGGADVVNVVLVSHATNHQEGGADEVVPALHASRHEEAGADEVTPALHHERHEAGGADEITGLFDLTFVFFETPTTIYSSAIVYNWTDMDISAATGADTAKAAVIMVDTALTLYGNLNTIGRYAEAETRLRAKGGVENVAMILHCARTPDADNDGLYQRARVVSMYIVPVDENEIFQAKVVDQGTYAFTNMAHYIRLVGYLK
jgi:hypothetical protein